MSHVLFLEIAAERSWAMTAIGPAFIGAFVRERGHRASLVHVGIDDDLDALVARIRELSPDLLGLSLTTRQWLRAVEVVQHVKEATGLPVVAGGLHPTFSADGVLATPGFDMVCRGEGELAVAALLDHLDGGGSLPVAVPNVQLAPGVPPVLAPPLPDLDALPFLARDLLDEVPGVLHLATQRGCPFPCSYCGARQYHDLYAGTGRYGRRRSVEDVVAELVEVRAGRPVHYAIFLDDTFTLQHRWIRAFKEAWRAVGGPAFCLHARVETVTRELLLDLAEAGCTQITYGVESGSERLRREVLRRPVSNQRFVDVFDWTREAGIAITANYIVGLPEETPDDLEQTFALHARLGVLDFGYFVFYPYPGTELYRHCRDRGYLPDDFDRLPANHRESVLRLPTLSPQQIAAAYDRFTALREQAALARAGGRVAAEAVRESVLRSARVG